MIHQTLYFFSTFGNMEFLDQIQQPLGFERLDLLAKQVVEGFISGLHKSPFHGYSSEFAEHKLYNKGESTKHIDWKLFARTEKLYTKRYEEETNLRCHLIIDNSSSMHYPIVKNPSIDRLNKISFSALASTSIMQLLKKQRDAVGLSVFSDTYEYYASEKGSARHYAMILDQLSKLVMQSTTKKTEMSTYLHQIAEKLKRRSLVIIFSDLFSLEEKALEELFDALLRLKHQQHEVILFHTYDKATELDFNFNNIPKRYTDIETGDKVDLYADNVREVYRTALKAYFNEIKLKCLRYKINYVPVDFKHDVNKVLTEFLLNRQKF